MTKKQPSILTNDMEHCIICGHTTVAWHHVINGTGNRKQSDKYGLIIPLCPKHHDMIHDDQRLDIVWKKKAEMKFIELYGVDMWMINFHKNYLDEVIYERNAGSDN